MGSFRRVKPSNWRQRYNIACCPHSKNTFVVYIEINLPLRSKKNVLQFINEFLTIVLLQTDSSILGGMIVSIGDKYADMSTKTKIQKLTKLIKET